MESDNIFFSRGKCPFNCISSVVGSRSNFEGECCGSASDKGVIKGKAGKYEAESSRSGRKHEKVKEKEAVR